jgi:hypothetical protein
MSSQLPSPPAAAQPLRLLDVVRQVAHTRFGQDGPGERFVHWMWKGTGGTGTFLVSFAKPSDVGRWRGPRVVASLHVVAMQ